MDPGSVREVDSAHHRPPSAPRRLPCGRPPTTRRICQSLPDSSYAPTGDPAASLLIATAARSQIAAGSKLDNEKLLEWIQAALGVLRSAAGNDDFFRRAARAAGGPDRFDFGCVLLRDQTALDRASQGSAGRSSPATRLRRDGGVATQRPGAGTRAPRQEKLSGRSWTRPRLRKAWSA